MREAGSEAERHKERAQKHKAAVDAKIAAATRDKGLLLVLTGNGKGKSSSAFGMVARTLGHGRKAAVFQFIKGADHVGERGSPVWAMTTPLPAARPSALITTGRPKPSSAASAWSRLVVRT